MYQLEQGPTEQKIIEQCFRTGRPLPKKIEDAPELVPGMDLYYVAYIDLHTCRSGMGDGPIAWTAIDRYATAMEFDADQREILHSVIYRMDSVYAKWQEGNK